MTTENRYFCIQRHDGQHVFISSKHMEIHADVFEWLQEAILLMDIPLDDYIKQSIEFNHMIGYTVCVDVDDTDTIVYATRKGRKWSSKLVLNREPEACNTLTVVLKRRGLNKLYLLTAYIGCVAEREEADFNLKNIDERKKSFNFWKNKALIYRKSDIE